MNEETLDLLNVDDAFKSMMCINLDEAAKFHNHMYSSLIGRASEIEGDPEISQTDKNYWKHYYETLFPQKLRETTFLLMFGHLEEMLELLFRRYNPQSISKDRGTGFKTYKSYVKSLLADELGENKDYNYISNALTVRNCLLHIAGRVSMSTSSRDLDRLVENNQDNFEKHNDRIYITASGLLQFQCSVRSLTDELQSRTLKKRNGVTEKK